MFNSLQNAARPAMTAAILGLVLPSIGALGAPASAATLASTHQLAQSQSVKQNAPASTLVFRQIDDPQDKTFNQLLGIDDQGVISGYFGSGAAGHPNKGYTVAGPNYNQFLSDNLPSSTQTQATGISLSNGTLWTSGFWAPTDLGVGSDQNYGFLRFTYANGASFFLSVNDPNTAPSNPGAKTVQTTQVLGINKSLNAVGFYNDANGNAHGFVYSLSNGQYAHPFHTASAVSSSITGINDNNDICGFYMENNGVTKGYVQLAGGTQIKYQVPGAQTTQFLGVNNKDEAVGFYMANANDVPHGLLFNAKTRVATPIVLPGASSLTINGINNVGQAVGFFTDNAKPNPNTHGVLINNIP